MCFAITCRRPPSDDGGLSLVEGGVGDDGDSGYHRGIPGDGREEAVEGFDGVVSSTVAGRGSVSTGESPGTPGSGM